LSDSSRHHSAAPKAEDTPALIPAAGLLGKLDAFMLRHPWHPRIVPLFVYLALLGLTGLLRDWNVLSYPFAYTLQCAVPIWLFWRYRKLMPELNLKFDILAVPFAIWATAAWIGMGIGMAHLFPETFGDPGYNYFDPANMGDTSLAWTSVLLRLVGMSIVPPLVEEMFYRSLILRSTYRARPAGYALAQVLSDLPIIGEWITDSNWVREADKHPQPLARQFEATAYGKLSVFSVLMATIVWVFVGGHAMRDWPATAVISVAWCLLAYLRRNKGLGPVIWTHGLCNAMLWCYSMYLHDWRWF
jgi:membrane protease YdiL (CAAX protease family)